MFRFVLTSVTSNGTIALVLLYCTEFNSFAGLLHQIVICPIAIPYSIGQIIRNSSEDEIANVNFLYDDIVHAVKIQ